ncbi:MAG: hypothetical protein KDI61_10740 [Alphaproteobacteria bacterium]|nr:hypothetical protein [Alphaproteobacteria bacterium]
MNFDQNLQIVKLSLENEYEVIDYSALGISWVEVYGCAFSYVDLYELVGKQQFMTTFNFRRGSEASLVYGDSVTGTIYYSYKTNLQLKSASISEKYDFSKIFVTSPPSEQLSVEKIERLKYEYGGFLLSDIDFISFLPYVADSENYASGEKKVPNILAIEVDCSKYDIDDLRQHYLVKKNNDGVNLILFEKEQLIGITLAFNEKRIDQRILKHLGFNLDDVSKNINIWYYFYKVKERRNALSEADKERFQEIKEVRDRGAFIRFMKELVESKVDAEEFKSKREFISEIQKSCLSFEPSILLHGKSQIYWDLDSFIHISMRHIKYYQLGEFRRKTAFCYREKDLKTLIEKVLSFLQEEYTEHLIKRPQSVFSRNGRRAVFFNGDYYNLRIEPDGRLVQFHPMGEVAI